VVGLLDAVGEEIIMTTKEYHRPMPAMWWLHNTQLILFMIRELTSVFVAGYAVFLIIVISKVDDAAAFGETLSHRPRVPGHCPAFRALSQCDVV
jgi:hypothetical protein